MRLKKLVVIFSSILMLVLTSTMLLAVPPTKDTMTVTAGNSTDLGIQPFVPGNAQNQWFYNYTCVQTGTSLSDTIPITFTLDNAGGGSIIANVTLTAHGNPTLAGAISFSPNAVPFAVTAGGSTVTEDIVISTGALAVGVYDANVQISTDMPSKVTLNHDTIHIRVLVANDCTDPPQACFITDSSFNALLDCSGNPIALESSSGGTFQINFNAKNIIVATNPGQFYYNLIWTNSTGADHNISLTMTNYTPNTLMTKGTNALHAFVFGSGQIDPTQPLVGQFDTVNDDGTPCGTGTANPAICKSVVTVHAGETLWVTWHLAYAKVGQNTTSVTAGACPVGGDLIKAGCTVTDSDTGDVLSSECPASANGFLKREPH
jgi:hypothetical protein